MTYVPYEKRCIELSSGNCFIYPFCNIERKSSMLELILDNNALVNAKEWLNDIKKMRILIKYYYQNLINCVLFHHFI